MNTTQNQSAKIGKKTLACVTPHGVFIRKTHSAYTHVVVRSSERATRDIARESSDGRLCGVCARWAKDNGFVTSWHSSEKAAKKASEGQYFYDRNSVVLGIFEVSSPTECLLHHQESCIVCNL